MVTLGTWQLQRLEWKQTVIEKLNQQYAKADNPPILSLKDINTSDDDIIYGSVTGRFLHDKEILVGPKTHNDLIGFHVLTPLKTIQGTILVNRGWINEADKSLLPDARINQKITATGIIRAPDWNKFTPNNNPESDVWTKLDVAQIEKAKSLQSLSKKILYLDHALSENEIIKLTHQKWYPRNKHKQYAIFWFSMAVIFLSFFLMTMRTSKKET